MSGSEVSVMLVDDSAVIRGLVARMIETEAGLKIVASVGNGQMAVDRLARDPVDVIILDIEMPVMDGLTAIPKLLAIKPDVKIIMASTLTKKNAEISMQALQAGAVDYVSKPSSTREISGGDNFKRELTEKIRALGLISRAPPRAAPAAASGAAARASLYTKPVTLRPHAGGFRPRILAVGCSTGGPQALFQLFKDVKPSIGLPVVITQHMPATFTKILAEHINRATGWPANEASNGDTLRPGEILVAPGDYHMVVEASGAGHVVKLNQEPPENFCRPAVDPMFRSVVKCFGGSALGVILTGMGQDGLRGSQTLADAGGLVLAQDEATSVVWGMPGAVATAGICEAVLPIDKLGDHVTGMARAGAA